MSRYYSFNDFMNDVLEEADQISKMKSGCGLEELYGVKLVTFEAIQALLSSDWGVFMAVVIVVLTGPAGIALVIARFLRTPMGVLVKAILGNETYAKIVQMHNDRLLPQAVKAIGEKYRPKWKQIEGNRIKIDNMLHEAAEEMFFHAGRKILRG